MAGSSRLLGRYAPRPANGGEPEEPQNEALQELTRSAPRKAEGAALAAERQCSADQRVPVARQGR